MKYNATVLTAVFAFLATMTSAAQATQKPDRCPSIHAIQQFRFVVAYQGSESWGASQVYNKFDTNSLWQFAVAGIKATGYFDALDKANRALPTLGEPKGPFSSIEGIWTCEYFIGVGAEHLSAAITMTLPKK